MPPVGIENAADPVRVIVNAEVATPPEFFSMNVCALLEPAVTTGGL